MMVEKIMEKFREQIQKMSSLATQMIIDCKERKAKIADFANEIRKDQYVPKDDSLDTNDYPLFDGKILVSGAWIITNKYFEDNHPSVATNKLSAQFCYLFLITLQEYIRAAMIKQASDLNIIAADSEAFYDQLYCLVMWEMAEAYLQACFTLKASSASPQHLADFASQFVS